MKKPIKKAMTQALMEARINAAFQECEKIPALAHRADGLWGAVKRLEELIGTLNLNQSEAYKRGLKLEQRMDEVRGLETKVLGFEHYQKNHMQRIEVLESRLDGAQRDIGSLRGGTAPSNAFEERVWDFFNRLQSRLENLEKRVDETNGRVGDVRMDWRAELEKLMPLAKALNENPRVIYDDKPTGQFCVIGDQAKSGYSNLGRTWKHTRQSAEHHAASLIRNHPGRIGKLFVVQVVSEVTEEPNIKTTRV